MLVATGCVVIPFALFQLLFDPGAFVDALPVVANGSSSHPQLNMAPVSIIVVLSLLAYVGVTVTFVIDSFHFQLVQ